jgi:CBS domain-containing protein
MRAREIMSTPVITAHPETPLKEVAEILARHRITGVPVVDGKGHLVGIISESDFVRKMEGEQRRGRLGPMAEVLGKARKLQTQAASELMTNRVITGGPDTSVRELTRLMSAHDVNRIPIVEEGRLIGIVTRADILRTFVRTDTAISEEVQWRLAHELWIDPGGLEIATHNGVVTMAGEVDTHSDVALAERWAAATEGVVAVDVRRLRYRVDDRRIKD